jgi:predicted enzyme related to lactoylglutathione lyase
MNEGIRGQFTWHELVTTDAKAAVAFYSKVAGLKTQSPPNSNHTTFVAAGQPIGFVLDAAAMGERPNWRSFIATTNADETAREAESLGGKVLKGPMDLPGGGRAALLQDPQGAVFWAWSSSKPYDAPAGVPLGGMSWHELATTDHAAAFTFYQQLLGWHTTSSMDMGPQGIYRMFGPAGATQPFGGMYTKAAEAPGGPNWLPYIKVADARPATATAKKAGARILHGPAQIPGGGWITMGVDPQGAAFAIHSVAQAAPTKKKAAVAKRKAASKPKSKATKKVTKKKAARKTSAPRRAKKKAGSKK